MTSYFCSDRNQTSRSQWQGWGPDADDASGHLLLRSGPPLAPLLHLQVQSHRRRGPAEVVAAGVPQRITSGWSFEKVIKINSFTRPFFCLLRFLSN